MTARQDPRQRPFRFGVLALGASTVSARSWLDLSRRVEGEGWSSLVVGDHFLTPLSCTARLAAAAAVTTTLRLGSYVYCNDFRHPALLAKEAAELDQLSDGRFELGMGAGWLKAEYDMIGLPFDEGRVRADRFQEAVRVVKRLLAGETLTHEGDHYRFAEYEPASAPVQQPVPLLLGGGGPRMTRFASRHADIIAFDPMSTPAGDKEPHEFAREAFKDKVHILDEVSGERVDGGPERGILLFHVVRGLDELGPDAWVDAELAAGSPYVLAGPPSAMVDLLQERRERWGLTYHVCSDEDIGTFRPVVAALAGR